MRAELDALPILEQAIVPYRSERRMIDHYGNERPVMHACGHDMNVATLLAAANLLKAAANQWKVDDGLYDRVPVPDLMLSQHVVPACAGTVAIRSGAVLIAADSMRIRVIGGPCESSINPQVCVDPIPLSMRIVSELQDTVTEEPGNDYVAYANILLDIKTVKPDVRRRVLDFVKNKFLHGCRAASVPRDPEIIHTVRAPMTSNDDSIAGPVDRVFGDYFTDNAINMVFTRACEDFSILGAAHGVPLRVLELWRHSQGCK